MKTTMRTLAISMALLSPFTAPNASADTIKIAFIDPLSGPFANVGELGVHHFQFTMDAINAKGGVLGRKLELVTLDSKGNPQIVECIQVTNDDSFSMARRLAKEEGILAGISTGANVWAAIEVANYVVARLNRLSGARPNDTNRVVKLQAFCEEFAAAAFRRGQALPASRRGVGWGRARS